MKPRLSRVSSVSRERKTRRGRDEGTRLDRVVDARSRTNARRRRGDECGVGDGRAREVAAPPRALTVLCGFGLHGYFVWVNTVVGVRGRVTRAEGVGTRAEGRSRASTFLFSRFLVFFVVVARAFRVVGFQRASEAAAAAE